MAGEAAAAAAGKPAKEKPKMVRIRVKEGRIGSFYGKRWHAGSVLDVPVNQVSFNRLVDIKRRNPNTGEIEADQIEYEGWMEKVDPRTPLTDPLAPSAALTKAVEMIKNGGSGHGFVGDSGHAGHGGGGRMSDQNVLGE